MLATLWVDHGIYIPYVSMRLQNDFCFLPRHFSKLQLAPVNYKAEVPFHPDWQFSSQENTTSDWYNHTSFIQSNNWLCPFSTQLSDPCWFSWRGHRKWTGEVCFTISKVVLNCIQVKKVTSNLMFWKKRAAPKAMLTTCNNHTTFCNQRTRTVNQGTRKTICTWAIVI